MPNVDHPRFGAALIGRLLEAQDTRRSPEPPRSGRCGSIPHVRETKARVPRTAGAPRFNGIFIYRKQKTTVKRRIRAGGDRSLCMARTERSQEQARARQRASGPRDDAVRKPVPAGLQGSAGDPRGIEASLRRLAHYDYWSDTVRRSNSSMQRRTCSSTEWESADSGDDAAAQRAAEAGTEVELRGIRGTAWASTPRAGEALGDRLADGPPSKQRRCPRNMRGRAAGAAQPLVTPEAAVGATTLPAFETIQPDTEEGRRAFAASFKIQYRNTDPWSAKLLVEPCGDRFVVQEPAEFPLSRRELDDVYGLPFLHEWHPMYRQFGGVPALAEVKFSLVSSRGCFGGCSFCALSFHEPASLARSNRRKEPESSHKFHFKGYIHDVGGPTANFRAPACAKMAARGACIDRRCLAPVPCPNLEVDHHEYRELLLRLRALPGIKRVFIRSGIRYDYLMLDKDQSFFSDLVQYHISGQLKVAPEHVSNRVLELMGKPPLESFDRFSEEYFRLNRNFGKNQYLIPYFISGHPGATLEDALELALYLKHFGFVPDQVQDFYPTPGTLSTAMWRARTNPLDGKPVYIPRGAKERALQRALLQFSKPENRTLVREALQILGRTDLIGKGKGCLVGKEAG